MTRSINLTIRQVTRCVEFVSSNEYESVNVNPLLCADIAAWSKFMLGYICADADSNLATNLQVTVVDAQTRLISFVWGSQYYKGPVVFIIYFDRPCPGEKL